MFISLIVDVVDPPKPRSKHPVMSSALEKALSEIEMGAEEQLEVLWNKKKHYSSGEDNQNRQGFQRDYTRSKEYQQMLRYDQRNQHYQYRYDNNQDRNRFDNKRRPNKYQHHRNQHKAQIIFEFSDQNMMEMMQTVRGFINLIKANPTTRDHYKTNKLANRKYDNEVNESEIKTSNLDQVQQFFNEDTDLVFDALVAADYIDEIDCTDGTRQPSA